MSVVFLTKSYFLTFNFVIVVIVHDNPQSQNMYKKKKISFHFSLQKFFSVSISSKELTHSLYHLSVHLYFFTDCKTNMAFNAH